MEKMMQNHGIKISVIMPCRDEENTVGKCVDEACDFLAGNELGGEVMVVDNCSSDRSAAVARDHGATVIKESRIGYGYAIRRGLAAACGDIIIIADCDMTYDLSDMGKMIRLIDEGYDVVIGDRLGGSIETGAMSCAHRIGVRALSKIASRRFHSDVRDFHCGIRAISRESLQQLEFCTGGMEFATEMIARASKAGLRIAQIPVSLRKCPETRKSKLRTIRDGLRHLAFILSTNS